MDYFSSNEKVDKKLLKRKKAVFLRKGQFLYIAFIALFVILQSFFYCFHAEAISVQDTVNVNASVPSAEITPQPGGGGGVPLISDIIPPVISEVKIDNITENSAQISWRTDEIAIPQINYGQSRDFEKTYIGESFTLENAIFLENLLPKTLYYFEIIAIDRGGNRFYIKDLSFVTMGIPDVVPPANVSQFKSIAGDAEIKLFWINPLDADFSAVKIFRSDKFYPKNSLEGMLVYEGKENFFIDNNLTNGVVYYYTVFAYDFSGNYSSGAILKTVSQKYPVSSVAPSVFPSSSVFPTPLISLPISPLPTAIPIISPVSPEVEKIKLNDFDFTQNGEKVVLDDSKVKINPDNSLTVSIDSKKIPKEVGTMILILTKGEEVSSFLLKANKDKSEYSVTLTPPENNTYDLTVVLMDNANNAVKAISGNLTVSPQLIIPVQISWYYYILLILLIALILLLLRYILKKIDKLTNLRHKQKKDRENKGKRYKKKKGGASGVL